MSLSNKILIGMGLGIAVGLFFGEATAFLKIAGDAFILLLQMTVLPYIMVSLIAGLGSLTIRDAGTLGRKCILVLALLWAIGLAMVLVMPLAFPNWKMASFFSTSLIEPERHFNFLGLYIPSNLFYSLANNTVPAVVVFSFALGAALIAVKEKEVLLKSLTSVAEGLGRITNFLIKLAPFGVFAIIASAVGTLSFADFELLQVYMVVYLLASLLLTFWILPSLVTSLLPISYGEFVLPLRTAFITAFATGSVFVVLPILAEKTKDILKKLEADAEATDSTVDVVISTSFSFPNLGKILSLSFVLFAGWFSNVSVPASKYLSFSITGLFSFFGDPNVAVPFLLDLLRIPADAYRFYPAVDNLVGARFGTLLAAMYTLVLAVLGTGAVQGLLKIRLKTLARWIALSVGMTVLMLGGTRWFFESLVGHEYMQYKSFVAMDLTRKYEPASVYSAALPTPPLHEPGQSRLQEIRRRGTIRVGYFRDALPFAFVNDRGKLVGFDIEMAHVLARDMNVKLELVVLDRTRRASLLDSGYVDIVMCGMPVTMENAARMSLSNLYMEETLAFIVKDYRREEFSSREKVKKLDSLKIGALDEPYYLAKIRQYLPGVRIVLLSSPREFFSKKGEDLDAMFYSAESGSAWCLIYPEYSVAIPRPDVLGVPIAYGVARGDRELVAYIDAWIELKKEDRTISSLYSHWILGQELIQRQPRWSVIRDVLHWVD